MMDRKQLMGIWKSFLEAFLIILNFVLFIATIFSFGLGYWWLGIILIVVIVFIGTYVKDIQDKRTAAGFFKTIYEYDQKKRVTNFELSLEEKHKKLNELLKDKLETFTESSNDKT